MRISDWSSDVCSSDLSTQVDQTLVIRAGAIRVHRRQPDMPIEEVEDRQIDVRAHARNAVRLARIEHRLERLGRGLHLRHQLARIVEHDIVVRQAVDQQQRRSEEHTSELQSLMRISYAVFCLKKKKKTKYHR